MHSWIDAVPPSPNFAVAPSFPYLSLFSKYTLVGQDVSPFPPGSYTGAVSARQLADLGAKYCLVGHSERRRYFHETHADVAAKVKELVESEITPIVCLSEPDLAPQKAVLDDELTPSCLFCYEPPGDIGGTTTAPLDNIKMVTDQIKALYETTRVMYGGSVNDGNIESILSLDLVGTIAATASLNPDNFIRLINKISDVRS